MGIRVTGLQVRVTFVDLALAKPSLCWRKDQRCATRIDFLCDATYCFCCRSPLKLSKFRQVNLNDRCPVTDPQATACFPFELCISSYTRRSISVRSSEVFCTTYRFAVTRLSIFEISMTLRRRLPDTFHHLVGNSGCEYRLANNIATVLGYGMQTAIYESFVLLIRW